MAIEPVCHINAIQCNPGAEVGEVMQDEVVVKRDVMVTMRDGIKLACDVYRPTRAGQPADGAFPVILERTPYNKRAVSRSEITRRAPKDPKRREDVAAFFTRHGYVT